MRIRVLGIVLAGGKGTRLFSLTKERAKPAVPFGGKYRIIDFVLSNFINSGIYSIYVLTQFRSQSLLQHLSEGWQFGSLLKTQFVIPVPAQMRSAEFGVIEAGEDDRILAFHEKNPDAPSIPGDSEQVYASMGNYIFSTRTLLDLLREDARNPDSHHDFGKDILPKLAGNGRMFAYNSQPTRPPADPADSAPYWRDVGTIDAYYEANMDLRYVAPALNLYNREWPLRSTSYPDPPAKFTFDDANRRGQAIDSIVSGGCILSGGGW